MASNGLCDVSIIIPIYNGSQWIDKCFTAIIQQTACNKIKFEVCVCNDASNDNTKEILDSWVNKFKQHAINLHIYHNNAICPQGVGFAKNKAVSISRGDYLCFQDIDDFMLPNRILLQYNKALSLSKNTILGCRFTRIPKHSTPRYTKWANSLTQEQLNVQIYTSHGPTIIMPTWFCHRSVFDQVGGFSESGKGTPEDLLFFYKHIDLGGQIYRLDDILLEYYYHSDATSFSIKEETIWNIRIDRIQNVILNKWNTFTIWNAGKQGRKFYNALSTENKLKVIAMCDVDENKVGKKYIPFNSVTRREERSIDIVHIKEAKVPFVICIKLDMTKGQFEYYLDSMHIQEGRDYILFS